MGDALLLSGPPGVGKSTVARVAAGRLGWRSLDLDELIAQRAGRRSAAIIREEGEARFRALEAEVLLSMETSRAVMALGGGTLTSPSGVASARAAGTIVSLEAAPETLSDRLSGSAEDRPLLEDRSAAGVAELLARRGHAYAVADRRVSAEGSVEEVAGRVLDASAGLEIVRARMGAEPGSSETRVVVGRGLMDTVVGAVAAQAPSRPVLALLDAGVPEPWRARLLERLAALFPVIPITLPGGEPVKTWATLGAVLDAAIAAGCGRQSVVLVVGGGAMCDLAAMAANLLGRGAPLVAVPSTLLAQVDASVGGKCSVNMTGGRNLVGAFHPASDVISDLDLLESLSAAERRSGLAELFKMALIGDAGLFEHLERGGEVGATEIARSIALKAGVVARDPFERGERRILNLGHTLGHALEVASSYALRHGEAVAIGVAAASRFSAERGWLQPLERDRILAALHRRQLPDAAEPALLAAAATHIATDKKSNSDTIAFVGVHGVARVAVHELSLAEVQRGLVRNGGSS